MSVDILTNDGVRALSAAITSHIRLYVEDAVLVNTETVYDATSAAQLTYSDLPASTMVMTTTSCLPCQVELPDGDGTTAVSALDLEFSYLPQQSVSYNLIGVRARFYYEISEYAAVRYSVGDVVSYNNGYYKCIEAYTATMGSVPSNDPTHWESVTVDPDSRFPWGDTWKALSDSYILLYVSQLGNPVTLSSSLEVDYKLRIYLTNVATAAEMQERIVFDTLGPEYMAGAQLESLAAVATAFGNMRAAIQGMILSGSNYTTITGGGTSSADTTITGGGTSSADSSSEEETMKLAYFKTQAIVSHEFVNEDSADSTESPATPVALTLNRMDDGNDGNNYLSVYGTTRIKKARVTMGGSGTLESRAVKAASVVLQAYIPSSASATGSDYTLGTFTVTLSEWDEWEDKDIEIPALDNVANWATRYRNTKPMALKALATSVFYIQDFNIQEEFVGQTLPAYLELGVSADTILGSNKTTILD